MAVNAFPKDPVTVRDMILAYLDADLLRDPTKPLPRTYMGLPVDLSNLDTPITGYVVKGGAASVKKHPFSSSPLPGGIEDSKEREGRIPVPHEVE